MSATHPLYRKFKQVVEAGIICADEDRFVVDRQKFLRLIGATEEQWEHLRTLNEGEGEYLAETAGTDFVFMRPKESP